MCICCRVVLVIFKVVYCQLAAAGAHCDYCLYVGAGPNNATLIPALENAAVALKMYLNETFTTLRLDSMSVWMQVLEFLAYWFVYRH